MPDKTATLGTTQKCLSWTGGCLIKHLYKATTNKIWSFLSGFKILFPILMFYKQYNFAGIKIYNFVGFGAILED